MTATDTIFAPASGLGRAAVSIVRLSGPNAAEALRRLTGKRPAPRHATRATVVHPQTGDPLDQALVVWFPGPASFTGEDCAEFHLHGSRAVLGAVLGALTALPGCRLAEPGEFTRRAFLNSKMDLAAVEGLADLIDAETEAQRRQALAQLEGALGRWADSLRDKLLDGLALTEAAIDFADEGDIASDAIERAHSQVADVAQEIETELARPRSGERIRDGIAVAIAGPPNAGKSTLLNVLARRDAAIVSPHPGTTRDSIEVSLDLGGYPVRLIDTAGLRDAVDPVEQEGILRARARVASADLVLWLQDVVSPPLPPPEVCLVWTVGTKADLLPEGNDAPGRGFDLVIAAETGIGVDDLIDRLRCFAAAQTAGGSSALVTQVRHRAALEETAAALACAAHQSSAELLAEDLRTAGTALGRITGRIDVEEILGTIFARFCVGK